MIDKEYFNIQTILDDYDILWLIYNMSAAINNRVRESKPVKHEKPKGQPSKLVNHGA